ncbi:hypothetical protein [Catenulispora rubra]|uniref:hypothetical protein n=1 Tax=Catenulispora rubra TaxID=280293 RepID=UPI0018922F32|nr:hypothetical protein [Catenulispora rubra]
MSAPTPPARNTLGGPGPVDRQAVLTVLGEMNTAARIWRLEQHLHADPDGTVPDRMRQALDATAVENRAEILEALPDWIASLTQAVTEQTWTIIYHSPDGPRARLTAVVGPTLDDALAARARALHPGWDGLPDHQVRDRYLAELPGAVAIRGEHDVFVFGGTDD